MTKLIRPEVEASPATAREIAILIVALPLIAIGGIVFLLACPFIWFLDILEDACS